MSDKEIKIIETINSFDPNDEARWTKSGKPDATVLTEALGTTVTAKERDAAWAKIQEAEAVNESSAKAKAGEDEPSSGEDVTEPESDEEGKEAAEEDSEDEPEAAEETPTEEVEEDGESSDEEETEEAEEEEVADNLDDKVASLHNLSPEEADLLNEVIKGAAHPGETALITVARLAETTEKVTPVTKQPKGDNVATLARDDLKVTDLIELKPHLEQGEVLSRVWKDKVTGVKYFEQPYAGKAGLPVHPFL